MGIPYLVERWSQDDFDVLEDRHHRRPLLHGASRTAGPPLDVGERPLGGHGQASRTRLWADAIRSTFHALTRPTGEPAGGPQSARQPAQRLQTLHHSIPRRSRVASHHPGL